MPQDLLRRFEAEDPLGLGVVRWQARRLESRRFSSIWLLEPPASERDRVRGQAGGDGVVLKIYRVAHPERRQREFDDLGRVYAALGPEAGVVRPVACWAEQGAVLTLRAHGIPLARLVRGACRRGAGDPDLARAAALCTQAGAWLYRFQTGGRVAMRGERPHHLGDPGRFLEYVDERLRLLRRLRPPLPSADHARLVAHAAAGLLAVPAAAWSDVTWSHSDFGPHNILADGDRLTVLDFELAPQHPWFDVAYFLEALAHGTGPRADPARVQRLERAFLIGYGVPVGAPLLALFRLRHLACTYVSEARRGGMARLGALPGLLVLRNRLRRIPDDRALATTSRAA